MTRRKPKFHTSKMFKGIKLNSRQFPLIQNDLIQVYNVLTDAVNDFPRLSAFKIGLHYPSWYSIDEPPRLISRFFRSLDSQITEELKRRRSRGASAGREHLRYIWCKEIDSSIHPHFHIVILLNHDNFRYLGDCTNYHSFSRDSDKTKQLYQMIVDAWARVLDIEPEEADRPIHVPENGRFYLRDVYPDEGCSKQINSFDELFNRTAYLTKYRTRAYGRGRTFGTSLRTDEEKDNQWFRELLDESLCPR